MWSSPSFWSTLLLSLLPVTALQSPLPGFNIFPVQDLIFAGSYDGISFFPSKTVAPGPWVPDVTKIVARHNDTTRIIGVLEPGQQVLSFCTLTLQDDHYLYVGGTFSRINSTEVRNVAYYDLQSNKWHSVDSGVDDKVVTLACDEQRRSVLIGGYFQNKYGPDFSENTLPSSSIAGGILEWNHTDSKWIPTPFKGLNGSVESITLRPNKGSVVVGGNFAKTLDGVEQFNPFANPVDLRATQLLTLQATTDPGMDANRLKCGHGWKYFKGASGNLQIKLDGRPLLLSGIELTNPRGNDGMKEFQLFSYPSNGQVEMSRVVEDRLYPCGTQCILDQTTSPQRFVFHKIDPATTQLEIKGITFYGESLALTQLGLFSYNSVALIQSQGSSPGACSEYKSPAQNVILKSEQIPLDSPNAKLELMKNVVYTPMFSESGQYQIKLGKPDCHAKRCQGSFQVNFEITPTYDSQGFQTESFTGSFTFETHSEPHDLYTGYFPRSGKTPDVTIKFDYLFPVIAPDQNVLDPLDTIMIQKVTSQDKLNGLFEFVPRDDTSDGAIIQTFSQFQAPFEVKALAAQEDTLFVGGVNEGIPAVVQLDTTGVNDLDTSRTFTLGKTSGSVDTLALTDNVLYAGGNFQRNSDSTIVQEDGQYHSVSASNVAKYDLTQKHGFVSLHPSLTATKVTNFYPNPVNDTILMMGEFAYKNDSPTLKYIEYNPKTNTVTSPTFVAAGTVSAIATIATDLPWTFFAGDIVKVESTRATNVGYFQKNASFIGFPASPLDKDAPFLKDAVLNTGLLYSPQKEKEITPDQEATVGIPSVLIVGGLSQPDGFPGLGIYDGSQWKFLETNLKGEVRALQCSDNELFIGGGFQSDTELHALAVWSFADKKLSPLPTPIPVSLGSRVNKLVRQPNTAGIIVAGLFPGPEAKDDCENLCVLDADLKAWSSIGAKLPSEVTEVFDIVAYGDRVVVAPQRSSPDNKLLTYTLGQKRWEPSSLTLPAPPTYLSYDNTTRGIFISGKDEKDDSTFLYWWNENKSKDLGAPLRRSVAIREVMVIMKPYGELDLHFDFRLPTDAALLVSGELHLEGFGECSGALFNGTTWEPYFTTSRLTDQGVTPGRVGVYPKAPFFPRQREYLPTSLIILISLAIALGILFVIICAGLLLLFLQHKRQQESRQALVPLLSDVSALRPAASITSPLASPINAPRSIFADEEVGTGVVGGTTTSAIPMTERTVARSSSILIPPSS